jgi:hypothetical protein
MEGVELFQEGEGDFKKVPVDISEEYAFRNVCPSVTAVYHDNELELPENSDNPLILALPPFSDMKSILNSMSIAFAVAHAPTARDWPIERRILGIDRVSDVLVLTAAHVKLLDWLHIALRHRYRGFVPTRSLRQLTQENYESSQMGIPRPISAPGDSHSECMSAFGISGAGKTTLVKMVLSMFPMIIEHCRFRDIDARFTQVVWLLVSCPPNGSVLTLMKGILHWFDSHLRTRYVKEVKSGSNAADYIMKVIQVFKDHMTGVLVIDEIQFAMKSAEKTQLMGFLTNLLNSNHCTFILLGTPDAKRYIATSMRNGRRAINAGYINMDPFPVDDDWARITKAIIKIDFLPQPPADQDEIISVLNEVSAGLPAFAKLAWKLTQYEGLRGGQKMVTAALIRKAVKDGFGPVEGLLEALRTRDYVTLAKCEDLATSEIESVRSRMELERERRMLREDFRHDEFTATFGSCVAVLLEMGRTRIEAEAMVRRILSADPRLSPAQVIRKTLDEIDASDCNVT